MTASRLAGVWSRWWVAVLVLGLTVSSDYKFRIRGKTEAISGRPDSTILIEIAVYLAVLVFVIARTRSSRSARTDALTALFGCYAAYLALSATWSPYRSLAVVRGFQLLVVAALGFVLVRYARSEHFHRLAHGHVAVVTVSVVYGKLNPSPPVSHLVAGRFTWLSIHPVTSANWTALALLLGIGYLVGRGEVWRLWPRWLYGTAVAVVGYGLLASKTRGSVLGFTVGVLLCVFLAVGRRYRKDLVVAGLAAFALAGLTVSTTVTGYLARGEDTDQLATLNSRTTLWSQAFEAVKQSPVVGHGLGATRGIFQDSTGLGGAHNAFINVFVDGGAIGIALWLAVLLGLAFRVRRLRRQRPRYALETALVAGALVLFVVDGVSMEGLGAPATLPGTWLCVLVSWTAVMSRVPRRTRAVADAGSAPGAADAASAPGAAALQPDAAGHDLDSRPLAQPGRGAR